MNDGLTVLVKIVQAVGYITKDWYIFAGAETEIFVCVTKISV
jgi:hypothetical protein